jgi:hypothetical protein
MSRQRRPLEHLHPPEPHTVRRLNARVLLAGCAIAGMLSIALDRAPWPQAHAQAVLDAPPCEGARRELEDALARPVPAQADDQVRLKLQIERSRGLVAQRCFGREPDSAVSRRAAAPPAAAVPLVGGQGPTPARAAAAAPALPPPPVDVQRSTFTTVCDTGGCWDSNGARLNGLPGAPLTGPRGTCTTSPSGAVNCF